MSAPCLFLDRDGTVIVYKPYLGNPEDVELIEGSREALRLAREFGSKLFLFSNQSGVARGYYTLEDAHACNDRMLELLDLGPALFDDIFLADEMPGEDPVYRKPSPRYIHETMEAHDLNREHCYMIGDNASDVLTALNAGIHPVAVGTGLLDETAVRDQFGGEGVGYYPDLLTFVRTLAEQYKNTP